MNDNMEQVTLLTGLVTVRQLINSLLNLDMDWAASLSNRRDLVDYMEWEESNVLYVGPFDDDAHSVRDRTTVWDMGASSWVSGGSFIEPLEFKAGHGTISVRDLINLLINLDPEDSLAMFGSLYDCGLFVGKQHHNQFRYNRQAILTNF